MRSLIIVIASLFAINAYAARINCTTKMTKGRTDKNPKVTWCGAVGENIRDNGIKYRRRPKSCSKLNVELFSIRGDKDKNLVHFCEKIRQKNCYVVGIKDTASTQGMGGLSSHMVFSSVTTIPAQFSLGASGVGHKHGVMPGPGTIVRLDLSCRVKQ